MITQVLGIHSGSLDLKLQSSKGDGKNNDYVCMLKEVLVYNVRQTIPASVIFTRLLAVFSLFYSNLYLTPSVFLKSSAVILTRLLVVLYLHQL